MFGWARRKASVDSIARLHAAITSASREPSLYGERGMPDSIEGRFESLTLHVLLVLRRMNALPSPAADVAQELVDAVFAHLEIALREMGVGDFGVPKRMKKLATAFYDRTWKYADALDQADIGQLAAAIAVRLPTADPDGYRRVAAYCLASERALGRVDLAGLVAGPPFATAALEVGRVEATA